VFGPLNGIRAGGFRRGPGRGRRSSISSVL